MYRKTKGLIRGLTTSVWKIHIVNRIFWRIGCVQLGCDMTMDFVKNLICQYLINIMNKWSEAKKHLADRCTTVQGKIRRPAGRGAKLNHVRMWTRWTRSLKGTNGKPDVRIVNFVGGNMRNAVQATQSSPDQMRRNGRLDYISLLVPMTNRIAYHLEHIQFKLEYFCIRIRG